MKLTLEPTDRIETVEGQPCRLWKGEDDSGVPVHALIRMVSPQSLDASANDRFGKELQELQVCRELVSFDYRMVL